MDANRRPATDNTSNENGEIRRRVQARLRDARAHRGLTLKEVAEATGMSISSVQSLEKDDRSELSLLKIARIAAILDVSIDALFSEDPPNPPDAVGDEIRAALEKVSPRATEIFMDTPRFVSLDDWQSLIEELDFEPTDVGQVIETSGLLQLTRRGMFDFASASAASNGLSRLLLASLLWSEVASRPQFQMSKSGLRGANPFEDRSTLESDLELAHSLLVKEGIAVALEQLLKIRGIGILRACTFLYFLDFDSYRQATPSTSVRPAAIPFSRYSERALIDSGYLEATARNRPVDSYLAFVDVVHEISLSRSVRPDMVEEALFFLDAPPKVARWLFGGSSNGESSHLGTRRIAGGGFGDHGNLDKSNEEAEFEDEPLFHDSQQSPRRVSAVPAVTT